jgi:DNA (cytosine-5)-methyltransferase 1
MTNAHARRIGGLPQLPLRVAELFAGVGGFRLGLEAVRPNDAPAFEVVWGNQWEPGTKKQHAFEIYEKQFPVGAHSNKDISIVNFAPDEEGAKAGPLHAPDVDVLVGGFPCQDYSVARTLNQAAGLIGKKGVLWWEIHRFLSDKGEKKPAFLIFENVDRLLKSPANQRGRDFAVLLSSLDHLGYVVEWRVINAAEYGMPQRRRRVFIVGYHRSTGIDPTENPTDWLYHTGVMATAFPVVQEDLFPIEIPMEHEDLVLVSKTFNKVEKKDNPFRNAGIFAGGKYWTVQMKPAFSEKGKTLGEVLMPEKEVPREYYVPRKELKIWRYLKGAKDEERVNKKTGFKYFYSEGPIAFPDLLSKPSRTIITSEGGRAPSRFKHIIQVGDRYRRLTPKELEALNGFPPDHTKGVSDGKRAFLMGNALVVGVVQLLGQSLAAHVSPGIEGLSALRPPLSSARPTLAILA